jgi:protein-tyrosine phosphatase
VIDLHAHLLPDVDDGPASLDESMAILRAAAAAGTRTIAATPHVNGRYPTDRRTMAEKLTALRDAVEAAGIAIEVVSGAEIALDQLSTISTEDLSGFGLGGSSSVLIELPFLGWPLDLIGALRDLHDAGLRPVLAHPERNDEIQRFPARLEPIVADGVLIQVTAPSINGWHGPGAARAAWELLELGVAHLIASDIHGTYGHGYGLAEACRRIGEAELVHCLTLDGPSAVLSDTRPQPVPRYRQRRRPRRISWRRGI